MEKAEVFYDDWVGGLNEAVTARRSISDWPENLDCAKSWDVEGSVGVIKCKFRAVTLDQLLSHHTIHRAWALNPVESELVLRGW